MEILDVFSMNGIENVILKVSQTHLSKDFYPKGGGGGGCEVPWNSKVCGQRVSCKDIEKWLRNSKSVGIDCCENLE